MNRISNEDMDMFVKLARDGAMVPGACLVQEYDDGREMVRVADELVTERDELRTIVAGYRDQAHAATGALDAETRRADVAEQERDQTKAKLAADWHESPELPPGPGLYIAFWVEDGAWAAEYWPDGIEDVDGNKGKWLSLVDDSLRSAPVAWRHLPAVPAKYVQMMRAYAAQDGLEKIVSGSRGN